MPGITDDEQGPKRVENGALAAVIGSHEHVKRREAKRLLDDAPVVLDIEILDEARVLLGGWLGRHRGQSVQVLGTKVRSRTGRISLRDEHHPVTRRDAPSARIDAGGSK